MEATVRDIEARDRRRHVVVDGDYPDTEDVGICHRNYLNLRKCTRKLMRSKKKRCSDFGSGQGLQEALFSRNGVGGYFQKNFFGTLFAV